MKYSKNHRGEENTVEEMLDLVVNGSLNLKDVELLTKEEARKIVMWQFAKEGRCIFAGFHIRQQLMNIRYLLTDTDF